VIALQVSRVQAAGEACLGAGRGQMVEGEYREAKREILAAEFESFGKAPAAATVGRDYLVRIYTDEDRPTQKGESVKNPAPCRRKRCPSTTETTRQVAW